MKQWGATACRLSLALSVALGGAAIAQGDAKTDPRDLTPYLVPAGATPTTPDAEGFIRRWLLLEPIVKPNRSNAGFTDSYVREALTTRYFPDQFTIVPRDGQTVQAAEPLKWHAYDAKLFDVKLFNFAQALGKPTYGVIFWAVTIVDAPHDIENVRLAVGSNSASMWWVNGAETVGLFDDRRMVMDDVVSKPLTLRKGRNIIRGAVINGPGLSDFCLRFIDDQGKPLRDITIDIK
ncbi:MAG TPA: acetylxylan esterase [Sphingobium sp.]|nr:acetylxylan esterase [Sphingobium sp.]